MLSVSLVCYGLRAVFALAWNLHSGNYYPYRHLQIFPLLPPWILVVEWLGFGVSAVLLYFGRWRKAGVFIAGAVLLLSLSQRFSNQGSLIFIVIFYLVLGGQKNRGLAYAMIRYQIIIVYIFSALNKFDRGFLSGTTLQALFRAGPEGLLPRAWLATPELTAVLAWLVVVAELLLPVLLITKPTYGIVAVCFFHIGMALFLPGIWSFTAIMITMSILFLVEERSK